MRFQLPPRSQVGYLDPDVAGEGEKVDGQAIIMSDGQVVQWTPPPPKPIIPDWSGIESIKHYFRPHSFRAFPVWLYNKDTDEARVVPDAKTAAELGVTFRKATDDERAKYGLADVWDWQEGSPWRPKPNANRASFDPRNPGQGKVYIPAMPNPQIAQNELLRELVPLVTAAVVQAVKGGGSVSAPASVDPAQWEAFLQFQAWQKSQQAVTELTKPDADEANALRSSGFIDRDHLEAKAISLGLKVDGRWSMERLRTEVEKAEKAAA